jgi:hypothetical protein
VLNNSNKNIAREAGDVMTSRERHELIAMLVQNYVIEKERCKVWDREITSSYAIAQGQLQGACMALNLDFEESQNVLTVYTNDNRKIVLTVDA